MQNAKSEYSYTPIPTCIGRLVRPLSLLSIWGVRSNLLVSVCSHPFFPAPLCLILGKCVAKFHLPAHKKRMRQGHLIESASWLCSRDTFRVSATMTLANLKSTSFRDSPMSSGSATQCRQLFGWKHFFSLFTFNIINIQFCFNTQTPFIWWLCQGCS